MQYVCKTSTSFPSIWMQNGMLINLSQLKSSHHVVHYPASSSSSNSRAPDSWLKGRGFESLLEWQENFFSRVSFLCWLLFRYLFHPRVTAVACKRPWSFCQKRRWQATAKHTYTLCMWLCMKWYGAWLYGVHITHQDGSSFMWHQPCHRCKYTTSVDIQKCAIKT